jgi:hypothetical protein
VASWPLKMGRDVRVETRISGKSMSFPRELNPDEKPISTCLVRVKFVVGKSLCGQVYLLLRARPLTLRQKVLNMDTEFLVDLIKLMNKREGGRYVPYERRLSLQGPR